MVQRMAASNHDWSMTAHGKQQVAAETEPLCQLLDRASVEGMVHQGCMSVDEGMVLNANEHCNENFLAACKFQVAAELDVDG